MTNLSAIVVITLLTNISPDGARMTVVETVTTTKHYHRTWKPIEPVTPPPMPSTGSLSPMPSSRVAFFMASGEPMMLTGTLSAPMPAPDDVEMFTVEFPTETNRIYRFEGTKDLLTWEYLPPEIDGTGQPDTFYDKHEGTAAYRVVSREGVLPE
jgi:hypothetical protein